MKTINSVLTLLVIICALSVSAWANPAKATHTENFKSKIKSFLTEIDFKAVDEKATIFVDFLIAEDGDLYNVDFIVTDRNEIIILAEDFEKEFYQVDDFSGQNIKQYSVPVTEVLI